jgi:hypothetical protein
MNTDARDSIYLQRYQYIPATELPQTNIVEKGLPKTAVSGRRKERHGKDRHFYFYKHKIDMCPYGSDL